jgi:hypothetical protein
METPTPTPDAPKPGYQTSEFGVAAGTGLAALIPIIQGVLSKSGDTTVEVICLTVVAVTFIVSRTFLKR